MAIIDTAKDIYALAAKGLTIDLQEKLMQLREQALALQEENLDLRTQISNLQKEISKEKELTFNGEIYHDSKGDYCPTCHDKDGKLIRLHRSNDPSQGFWFCNVCTSFWA